MMTINLEVVKGKNTEINTYLPAKLENYTNFNHKENNYS